MNRHLYVSDPVELFFLLHTSCLAFLLFHNNSKRMGIGAGRRSPPMRVMTVVLPRKSDPVMMEVIYKNRLGEKVTVNENGMISQTMDAAGARIEDWPCLLEPLHTIRTSNGGSWKKAVRKQSGSIGYHTMYEWECSKRRLALQSMASICSNGGYAFLHPAFCIYYMHRLAILAFGCKLS
ncbi:hypothetical protein BJ166DRAFT_168735 [Pestalotiopsis sp. NC0098]|nr:hypothetical protein BJ166DRAFT_168735 [Pestalotiopsis sp. NC0098]